ncbi:MAG TPA: tyrosine-protein phosphatase [Candidatus Binatus sp.]|nr:tyrosine-protein phosphatase [Candidatus Binatus sp.]
MVERRFVRGALRSDARRRAVGAIVLMVGSMALLLLEQTPAAAAPEVPGLPNYGVIWEGKFTRSGQPSDEGWTWLRRQGVRSLVNFRGEDGIADQGVRFRYKLWVPFTKETPPTDDEAEEFLTFVRDRSHWPIHMHCKSGRDRTGLMAALVRYAIDGWPLERALAEARTYRDGEDLAPLYVAWLRRWAADHPRGSHRLELAVAPRG